MKYMFLQCEVKQWNDLVVASRGTPASWWLSSLSAQVLHKLVKEMSANSRERAAQLDAAYQLYENPVSCSWDWPSFQAPLTTCLYFFPCQLRKQTGCCFLKMFLLVGKKIWQFIFQHANKSWQ